MKKAEVVRDWEEIIISIRVAWAHNLLKVNSGMEVEFTRTNTIKKQPRERAERETTEADDSINKTVNIYSSRNITSPM